MSGKTFINDSVFVEIAREAMHKVEEVFKQERKGALSGLTRIFTERFAPQISVKKAEASDLEESPGSVAFEVKLTVVYGVKIPEVAQKVRERIVNDVESLTGYKVDKVDIIIDRIIKPEDIQEDKKENQG
jgi:uncharacterized alkaline shock family protein YloU